VLAAADRLPEVKAVATIGAPSSPRHVKGLLAGSLEAIERTGEAEVELAGRRFTIPAKGDTSFDMSVELDLLGSAASLAPLLTAGASRPLEYALYGSFEIALPFAKPLNFSRQGTILVR